MLRVLNGSRGCVVAACGSVRCSGGEHQGLDALVGFRRDLYGCLTRRRDALVDLCDALVVSGPVLSLPYLSLDPVFRRGHGSVYAALAQGGVQADRLRDLLAAQLPAGPPLFAVDPSVWVRGDAECSPGRGVSCHRSRHSAGQPVVAGWCYQWVVGMELARNSWTAPVDARRLAPGENSNLAAAAQIQALLGRLPPSDQVPMVVFDGGYDSAQLTVELGGSRVQVVVRIRSDRVFFLPPPARAPGQVGRPRRHGARMALDDPATWPAPDAVLTCDDEQYGHVEASAWYGLHPKQRTYRDPDGLLRVVPGTILRVHVSRLPGRSRAPKTLWLWWAGPAGMRPDLDMCWRASIRRFDIEHTFKFGKQILHWTLPRPRTPRQADLWTWLQIAGYTQLRLARPLVADLRLPWEQPVAAACLTPSRVRRRFRAVLAATGTPAGGPKPCGRSPGRPKGTRRGPAPRYPAVKATA